MRIDDPTYPAASETTDVVMLGYRPKEGGDPGEKETVRVPASLFNGANWPFRAALSEDEAYLHVYTMAGAYRGSLALVDLAQPDLELE